MLLLRWHARRRRTARTMVQLHPRWRRWVMICHCRRCSATTTVGFFRFVRCQIGAERKSPDEYMYYPLSRCDKLGNEAPIELIASENERTIPSCRCRSVVRLDNQMRPRAGCPTVAQGSTVTMKVQISGTSKFSKRYAGSMPVTAEAETGWKGCDGGC